MTFSIRAAVSSVEGTEPVTVKATCIAGEKFTLPEDPSEYQCITNGSEGEIGEFNVTFTLDHNDMQVQPGDFIQLTGNFVVVPRPTPAPEIPVAGQEAPPPLEENE